MINEEMARAVRYRAAFETTWMLDRPQADNGGTRRRWLQRHLIDLGRMEHAESEATRLNSYGRRIRRGARGVGLLGADKAGDHRK